MKREGRTLIGVVMGSADHFADSRELLEYGARTGTLRDRLFAMAAPEEGGTGIGVIPPSDPAVRAAISTIEPLDDGRSTVTDFPSTDLGLRIEEWLRSVAPVIAGGSS